MLITITNVKTHEYEDKVTYVNVGIPKQESNLGLSPFANIIHDFFGDMNSLVQILIGYGNTDKDKWWNYIWGQP